MPSPAGPAVPNCLTARGCFTETLCLLASSRHLRVRLPRRAASQCRIRVFLDGGDVRAGGAIPVAGTGGILRDDRRWCWTIPQCLPVGVLYARRHARVACDGRTSVVASSCWRRWRRSAFDQWWDDASSASHCSGTPSTSCGSACSRSYTLERIDMSEQFVAQGSGPGPIARHGSHRGYIIGFVVALILTLASFAAASTHLIYGPSVPILLGVLAIAQMGVHLIFFFHISSAPDQTNNFLSLGVRHPGRRTDRVRIDDHHGEPQPHDAVDGETHGNATLGIWESRWPASSCCYSLSTCCPLPSFSATEQSNRLASTGLKKIGTPNSCAFCKKLSLPVIRRTGVPGLSD